MGKYGESAIRATRLLMSREYDSPIIAWDVATKEMFKSYASQVKSCPKSAFLSLCGFGVIIGIPKGVYCNSVKNKNYVEISINLLKQVTEISEKELWNKVKGNKQICYNQQMDVVHSLWREGLLKLS